MYRTRICVFFVCFRTYLMVRAQFAQMLSRSTEEGHPDTVVEVWARSVQCVARGVCSEIFSAGVGKTISRAVSVRRCFVFCLSNVGVFAHTYLVENGTACRNSEFPVKEQVWGTLSSKFGRAACREPCATRACAVGIAILLSYKKQAARPNCLGQMLMLGVFCSNVSS